jgi:hypothetical protein
VPGSNTQRDCRGTCDGRFRVNECRLCLDPASKEFNRSCDGCDGVPRSGVKVDCQGQCGGIHIRDVCGVCLHPIKDQLLFNASCRGCDGQMRSTQYDVCGTCGGSVWDRSDCPDSRHKSWVTVGAVTGSIAFVAISALILGYCYLRQQRTAWNTDVVSLMAQYEQLADADGQSIGPDVVANSVNSPK